jgi:cytochrome c oxidase subunit 1
VFALYAGIFYWFPKITGRRLDERLGTIQFWMTFVGFHMTFFVQHLLGLEGMPRRVVSYLPSDDFTVLNRISTIGAALLGASTLPFLWNVWRALRRRDAAAVAGDNPWGGQTLEWATSSPPPAENFDRPLPPIRSNRPVWDADHP